MKKRMCRKLLVLSVLTFALTSCNSMEVPNVVGEEVSYAKGILKGQGFEVEVNEKTEDGVRAGQVLNQEPNAQTSTNKGSKVKITLAKPPIYAVSGSLRLVDSDISGADDNCYGSGGYGDIKEFMPVTIRDGNRNIIATGQTGQGKRPLGESYSSVICVFEFTINSVPKSEFYTITVGRRGELNYSFKEMQEKNWKIDLSLG